MRARLPILFASLLAFLPAEPAALAQAPAVTPSPAPEATPEAAPEAAPEQAQAQAPEAFKWSVQYLIDNSQAVFGRSMAVYPRANRGLALSPDGNFLYSGYIQSFNNGAALSSKNSRMTNAGEVRKIDVRVADYENATVALLPGPRGKAIAVDDRGNVYLADDWSIDVYDADLRKPELQIPMQQCEGVALTRERGDLVLYASDRLDGTLHRFIVDPGQGSATPAGLGGSGVMQIPGAKSLRGVAIDPKGRIWIADLEGSKVLRVNPDGTGLTSIDVRFPMAIAFDGNTALITCNLDRQIALATLDMVVTGNLSVPWEELDLAPWGNNRDGGLSSIAVLPGGKGFFVADEHGQTAHQKSTYGRTDQNSEVIDGKLYIDAFQDDNEPILRATPVEVQAAPAASP